MSQTVTRFPALARPLPLRHLTLRNRITFGAHTANMRNHTGLKMVRLFVAQTLLVRKTSPLPWVLFSSNLIFPTLFGWLQSG